MVVLNSTTMGCGPGVGYGKEMRWVRGLPGPDLVYTVLCTLYLNIYSMYAPVSE